MSWKDKFAEAMKKHPKKKPLTESGAEIPDPVSMDPPLGYRPQPSMFEVIRKMIHDEKMRMAVAAEGMETPEEADDFDVEEDQDTISPYEEGFDPPADIAHLERMRNEIDVRIRNLRPGETAAAPAAAPSDSDKKATAPSSDTAEVKKVVQ